MRLRKIIFNFLILAITSILIIGCGKSDKSPEKKDKYFEGQYIVGTDILADEYIIFAEEGKKGEVCIYKDRKKKEDNIIKQNKFSYNLICTLNEGESVELKNCYAVHISDNPKLEITGAGNFKVGMHLKSGRYCIIPNEENIEKFSYSIISEENIVSGDKKNDVYDKIFELSDGDYIDIKSAYLIYENMTEQDVIEKTKNMTDDEKCSWIAECYRIGFFQDAIYGLNQVKKLDQYKDINELIEKCNLMLNYQGVYESSLTKDLNYIVLDRWNLYEYDFNSWESRGVDKLNMEISIEKQEEQHYLTEKNSLEYPGKINVFYFLIEDEYGAKGIIEQYSNADFNIMYVKDKDYSKELLEEKYQTEINREDPYIGMTSEKVCESTWGKPNKINKTTVSGLVSEQWIYDDNRYIYIDNGIVTAIQE